MIQYKCDKCGWITDSIHEVGITKKHSMEEPMRFYPFSLQFCKNCFNVEAVVNYVIEHFETFGLVNLKKRKNYEKN